ncbi:hypothetical protein [Sphingobacterium phlebotomi]|uniref:hypothetical protein n=1 Tax=Sphingobacterium phlebotomi TaxID=2605433 RepID=UPI001653A8DC|nr:hypothetical protein [Sphingobacterium phlebotomi]
MNHMFQKWGLTIMLISFFVLANAQTSTFSKTIGVSVNNKVELTDMSNQPLKIGGLYRVQLSVLSTGTKTGAEYLVWYNNANSQWTTRMVTVSGTTSNYPTLEVIDNVVKVATQHTSTYQIKVFVEYYDANNPNTIPSFFGASYHWQRNTSRLYYLDGNVGIGTATPSDRLAVNGNIRAKEIKVEIANWPDYVFGRDYDLKPLWEVERYINENGHLPEIPKASEVEAEGISLGEMNKLLLKKVEELTLHLIEKEKEVKEMQTAIKRVDELEKKMKEIQEALGGN